MDPEMLRFFKKIMNSFFLGFMWIFGVAAFGLFYKWGYIESTATWQNILFYALSFISFLLLIWYYYKSWK